MSRIRTTTSGSGAGSVNQGPSESGVPIPSPQTDVPPPGTFGTQLVLLSRALAVVAESTREATDAMDSVFLGQDQRATVRLDLGA